MKLSDVIVFFLVMSGVYTYAQTPTIQDCLGAIPICQNQYSQSNAYPGDGNYHSEVNGAISCLDNEYYSVWYTFTAQSSGLFRFVITPNTYSNDYDWAVFNLTNASCANIYTNPSLCVSCNSYGDYSGSNGSTGASSANGGYGNSNGPGNTNGPPFNADIPVTAGSTYAMLICNWSQSSSGYSINFNGSTAAIFDNVPPEFQNVTSQCGDSTIVLQFSEYVMCNSVQATDFRIEGPAGNYPVISAIGPSCALNGSQDRFFKIRTNQRFQKGEYKLILVGPVNDLCGNTATSDTILFGISGVNFQTSSTPAICNPNGTATCTAIDGLAPYNYQWANGQTTSTATGLSPGTYHINVIDTRGCSDSTFVVVPPGDNGSLQIEFEKSDVSCFGGHNGWVKVHLVGGSTPNTFNWSNGMSDSIIQNLPAGLYTVTASNSYGCVDSDSVEILQNIALQLFLDSTRNEVCSYASGAIFVHAEGGVSPYRYVWTDISSVDLPYVENIHAGNYIVSVFDSLNCSQTLMATVDGQPYPVASFNMAPQTSFLDDANVVFANYSTNYSSSAWDFGDGDYSNDISPTHQYQALGHFSVMLVVQSDNLCFDTLVKFVDVVEDFSLFIPNAFSPNADGLNDVFGPSLQGVSALDYLFEIYSRWGDLVFYTNDINKLWNGKSTSNIDYPFGLYYYKIIVKDLCDNPHEYSGTVVIVK